MTQGRIAAAHGRFSRILQVAPMCIPSSTPKSASVPYRCCPYRVASSISTAGHVRACPGPTPLRRQNCSSVCGDLDAHLIRGSLGPPESTSERHHDRFSCFCRAHRGDWQTDRPRYSVCSNRSHL